jgi:hypothetical protein
MKSITLQMLTCCLFASAILFVACNRQSNKKVQGYAPIYSADNNIQMLPAKAYIMPGKIMTLGSLTFQIDYGSGVHVIESADMANAKKTGFISVPAITEMHMQNGVLFVDNGRDLVSIRLGNALENFQVLDRITNFFPDKGMSLPSGSGVYFECVDSTKGVITGWEKKELINPSCRTI